MTLLILEALGALLLMVFIVWWTMFSGRNKGEMKDTGWAAEAAQPTPQAPAPAPAESPIDSLAESPANPGTLK